MPRLLSGRQPSVKIGIPSYSEDLTTLSVVGISSLQKLSVDGSTGTDGQYLRSTGTGLKWEDFLTSTLREEETFTATSGQTMFILNYNVGFIDVFVNGVRLTTSEYSSSSGTSISLYEALFEGDTVDIIKYNTTVTGVSLGGGSSETDTLDSVVARGSTTTSGIQVGDLRSTQSVYTDIIRRQTDNSSTTKISLETNSIRLFAGHGTTPKIRINGNVNITTDLNVVGVSTFSSPVHLDSIVGTGTGDAIQFSTDNGSGVAPRWRITNSGNLIPTDNDSYDIGSAEYKVRDFYLSDSSLHTESGKSLQFFDGVLTWGGEPVILVSSLQTILAESTSFKDFKKRISNL